MTSKKNVLVFFEVAFLIVSVAAFVLAVIDITNRHWEMAITWLAICFGASAKSEAYHLKLAMRR